jgi:hypothetical protein
MRKEMKRSSKWLNYFRMAVYAGISSVLLLSCSKNSYEGMVVVVELTGEAGMFDGSRLIVIDAENPGSSTKNLTKDFHSACSPSVNHEGRYLSFQGKQHEMDPWQIWVMDLKKGETNKLCELPENCTHPAALPDGTIVFSRESTMKGIMVHELWSCHMDGSGLTQLTFDPSSNLHATVLKEGRVLFTSSVQYPDSQSPVMMVMRPDGSKAEIYFREGDGVHPISGGSESDHGYIYFVGNRGNLARVLHKRPLHTFENISAELSGSFSAVIPEESGCLTTYQPSPGEPYGLYFFDPESRETPTLIYQGDHNITDPVRLVAMAERPRILPSAVNPDNPTALLMSQDINHSQLPFHEGITGDSLADRIRVSTLDKELGIVEVKEDGSFYLKMDSDIPFRIETLNKQGETVRGPSDWIYLRPNERRGCVGCHADHELAPKNFQPLAVKEDPVELFAEMKEKSQ